MVWTIVLNGQGMIKFSFFYLLLLFIGVGAKKKDTEHWEQVAKDFGNSYYSQSTKDSVYKYWDVNASVRGLRTIVPAENFHLQDEFCVYEGGWEFINAGFAILTTTVDSGDNSFSVVGKIFTNRFMSTFYEAKDYAKVIMDLNGFYPLFFEHHIKENAYEKHLWILYDHTRGKLYSNDHRDSVSFTVTPFIHDYFSLLSYLRGYNFSACDTFTVRCFAHMKDESIFFQVKGSENVTVKAGTFTCYRIEPRLVGEGRGFTKNDKMTLWLSKDSRRRLIKASSKVRIGSIHIRLIHVK